ncbi:MAG TPA: hypothetical protein VJA28_02510 [Patescibacteria group bacterium]|nr:hypothetical protein [Patescibacteria group bacterium]
MNNETSTTETSTTEDEVLLADFFNEVENRIPSNSTKAFSREFWILCATRDIPPTDRELFAESIITGKKCTYSAPDTPEKYDDLSNNIFFKLTIDGIKTAAAEKKRINILRADLINSINSDSVKDCLRRRLKTLLLTLATSDSPFTINKINNLIDEFPRLGFEEYIVKDYVKLMIEQDPLLDPNINDDAREIIKYINN